jgi:hypothetical protein
MLRAWPISGARCLGCQSQLFSVSIHEVKCLSVSTCTCCCRSSQPGESQGDSGDFGLLSWPPIIYSNLSNGAGQPTYDAYVATGAGAWGASSQSYCCLHWDVGCPSTKREYMRARKLALPAI